MYTWIPILDSNTSNNCKLHAVLYDLTSKISAVSCSFGKLGAPTYKRGQGGKVTRVAYFLFFYLK